MTAAAIPGLQRRAGTPPAAAETDETASLTSSTTTVATTNLSSTAACGNVLRTMFLGENDKSNTNNIGSDSEEQGLDLAKHPLVQITVPFFLLVAVGTKFLAQNFPYVLAPAAATHTYKPAAWVYDATDTHFDNPEREGRLLAFMARASTDWGIAATAIACDEYTAVCIDPSGEVACC